MKITEENVRYIAHLGRLELTPDEIEQYTQQLDGILQYMDALNALDTEGVEPTSHAIPIPCVMREDQVRESLAVEKSLQNAPSRKGSSFKVPPVIEVD